MKTPLRILHLEDDPHDVTLVQEILSSAGIGCEVVHVDTRNGFLGELAKDYDLILADYSLPKFNGLEALAAARQTCPEVPFIVLSGTVGEEFAIDAVKSGATDYVLKHRVSRLVPALQRAVREVTEHKRRAEAERALQETEERFRATFEQAAVGITHAAPDGRLLRVNQRFADMLGYTRGEVLARNIREITCAEDFPADQEQARRLLAGDIQTYSIEKRYLRRDGTLMWGALTASLVRDESGRPDYLIGVVQDITARKRADAARYEAEQRFAQLLQTVAAVATIVDLDECLVYCNPYLLQLTGWRREEVLGRSWGEVFLPDDQRGKVRAQFAATEVVKGRFPRHCEHDIVTRHGQRRLISWNKTPLHDMTGRVIGLASLGYDVTDQRAAQAALDAERNKLRGILDAMQDAVCIIDAQHNLTYANPSLLRQFGPIAERPCYEYFHGRNEACTACPMPEVFAGRSTRREWQSQATSRSFDVFATPISSEDGTLSQLEILHDVTARKMAETSLLQRTRELQTLMDNAPDIILRLDRQGRRMFVNRRWCELIGIDEAAALGRTARELGFRTVFCDVVEEALAGTIETGEEREFQEELDTTIGRRWIHARVVPERGPDQRVETVLIIARDITEERALQQQLSESQKMEVIGQLAAGVAHDINNVLAAISGYTALARAAVGAGHQAGEYLDHLEDAALQAAGVAKGLLAFSHQTPASRRPVDLRRTVDGAVRLLKRLLPATIETVWTDVDGPPLWVLADSAQLQQVVLNLAINSRDAMPAGGLLRISLNREAPAPGGDSVEAGLVTLTVSDSGCGIPADVLPRVFEPFFTTKAPKHGTGLGLLIVKSIVEHHEGAIEIHSEPDKGAMVIVRLPLTDLRPPAESEQVQGAAAAPGEMILIAEDNVQVLDVISVGLRTIGCEVVQARDSMAALEQAARRAGRIRLAILDLDLPGESGLEVLRRIRRAAPEMPAVIVTGCIDRDLGGEEDERTRVVQKPFRLPDLLQTVIELLRQRSGVKVAT